MFALCFIAYTFSYFGRYNFSTCLSAMSETGVLDKAFGGIISSAYLVFYGAGQFINGRLGVKVSPKIMVAIGLFGSGCANILMGCSSNKYLCLAAWAANGFFNSMLWSPIIRAFTDWMSEKERVKAGANISLTIPVGMTLSYLISAFILKISDWRNVFILCGLLLLIGGTIWISGMSFIRNYIKEVNSERIIIAPNGKKPSLGLAVFFGSGIALVAVVALFNGSLKDAVLSWAPSYLIDTYGFSDSTASLVSSILPLFSVLGPYIAVYIDRRWLKNELAASGVMFASAALCFGGVMLLRGSLPLLTVFLLATSMCCMWGVNTMILTFVPYRFGGLGISSAVTGTLNCMAYIAASSCTVLYGSTAKAGSWTLTVIIWTAFAVGGATACFALSLLWKKLRPN